MRRRWSVIFVLCVIAPMCRTVCPKWKGPGAPKKNLAKKLAKEHPPVIKFGVFKSEGEKIKIEDCAVTCATHFGDIEQSHTKLIPVTVPSLSADGHICSCVLNYEQIESYLIEKQVSTVEFFGRAEKSFCSLRFWIDGQVPIKIPYEERANVLKSLFSLRRTDSGKGLPETSKDGAQRDSKSLKKSSSLSSLRGTDSEKSLPETSKDGSQRDSKSLKKSSSLPSLRQTDSEVSLPETEGKDETPGSPRSRRSSGDEKEEAKNSPSLEEKGKNPAGTSRASSDTVKDERKTSEHPSSATTEAMGTSKSSPEIVEEGSAQWKESSQTSPHTKKEATESAKASPERRLSRQSSGAKGKALGPSKPVSEIVEEEPSPTHQDSAEHSRLLEKKHSKRPSVEFKEPEPKEMKPRKQGQLLTRLSRLSTTNQPEDIPEDKIVVGTFASKKAWFDVTICKVTCRTTFGFIIADDFQKIPFAVAKVSEDETECQCLVNVGTIKKLKMFDSKGHTFSVERMPDFGPKRKPQSKPEPKPELKPVNPPQVEDELMKTRYAEFIQQCKRFYCAGKLYLENIMTKVEIPYEKHKKDLEAKEMEAKNGKTRAFWYLGNPAGSKRGAKKPDDYNFLIGTAKRTGNQEVLSDKICQEKCNKMYGSLVLYPGVCIGYTQGTIARNKKTCKCHLNIAEIRGYFAEQEQDLPKEIFEDFVEACRQAGSNVHEAGLRFLLTHTKVQFVSFESPDSDGEQTTSCC